jgi:hypothetical protein
MQDRTPRLDLPWLMPAQAQKHVTVNEALARLDMLVQASVLSRSLADQPPAPAEGEGYLLPDAPQGEVWSSQSEGVLMVFHEGVWTAVEPWAGLAVYVADEAVNLVHDGAQWTALSDQIRTLGELEALGVGTQADAVNRVAIKSTGVLMSADDAGPGDMRLTLNKSDASRTASLVFQSNWSGRAEFGLAGEEAFSIKVSDDGSSWLEALKVSHADGVVRAVGAGGALRSAELERQSHAGKRDCAGRGGRTLLGRRLSLCLRGGQSVAAHSAGGVVSGRAASA